MKNITTHSIVICFLLLLTSCQTNPTKSADPLVFLCGNSMEKETLLKQCQTTNFASVDFCDCWVKEVPRNFTLNEWNSANRNAANYDWENNLDRIQDKLLPCFQNLDISEEDYLDINNVNMQVFYDQWERDLKLMFGDEEYNELSNVMNWDGYIKCVANKVVKDFSIKEMLELGQKDSHVMNTDKFMKTIHPSCWEKNIKH